MRPCWMALTPPNGCICSISLSPIRHKTRLKGWPNSGITAAAGYEFIGVRSWELTTIPSQPLLGRWFSLFNGLVGYVDRFLVVEANVLESNSWFFFPPIFRVQMKKKLKPSSHQVFDVGESFILEVPTPTKQGKLIFRMIHTPLKINGWNPKSWRWMENDFPFQLGDF